MMTPKSAFAAATAPTYDGFYLRNNLSCTGAIPSAGPYNLCPDIIQSNALIPNAQSVLSSQQSWSQMYDTTPTIGQTNYYYVRGMNGAAASIDSQVALYYAPAQLIMFPSSWKNNMLSTSKGLDTVNVQADPGHIDVGDDVFVWNATSALADQGDFYSFVAQVNDAQNSNPIPTITSWLDMSALLSQDLGFGFRNTCYVDGTANTWYQRLQLNVPQSLEQSGQLMLNISGVGLVGDTIGLIGDVFTANQKPIIINPFQLTQDGQITGININVEPGFGTSLTIQYWNTASSAPAPGSTLSVEVDYVVPPPELVSAASRGLINSSRSRYLENQVGIGPTPSAVLGAARFIVGNSSAQ